jgi:hypothetical protein
MLSKEIKTHLVDSVQGDELLCIQIDQPSKVISRFLIPSVPQRVFQ